MLAQAVIRIYRFSDRPFIRKICSDTADLGKPVEKFFYDREIFADLMTAYYTDFEPESLWVADYQTQVVGYLSGCIDSRRYTRIMWIRIIPKVFMRAICRGAFLYTDTWRILISMLKSYSLGGFNRKRLFDVYPAHLHINLQESFRHQGLGVTLVEHFLHQARRASLSGVRVSVCQDNKPASNFFTHLGFSILGRYPMVRSQKMKGFMTSYTLVYGRRL